MYEAVKHDSDIFFEVRNDEESRLNSLNTIPIYIDEHQKWFRKCLDSSTDYLLVAKIENYYVGVCRFNKIKDIYWISYAILEKFRGKGYAKIIIKESLLRFKLFNPTLHLVYARIKKDNILSIKSIQSSGFYFDKVDSEKNICKDIFFIYKCNLAT